MHEFSLVQGMLKILEDEIAKHGASRVTRVHVRVGELANLVPDSFTFAFETVSPGTVAEGAELELEIVPGKGRCGACDIEFKVDSVMFFCPQCGGVGSEIVSGRELEVAEIEAD